MGSRSGNISARRQQGAVTALALLLAVLSVPSQGAENSDVSTEDDSLKEIVVNANRRDESIQKVGASVAAETGAQLQAININRPEDLTRLVPGLTAIPNAGSAASSYSIRGVGQSDFTEHEEQPVAVYQDGVYIALSAITGFPIFDVQRVEVERGPQGTLFGRNATGGLIQSFSNQPTEDLEAGVGGTTGSRNLARYEGFVSGGNEVVSGRLAFYHSEQDGFIKNDAGPNLLASDVNAGRAQLLIKPDDATKIKIRLEVWGSDGNSVGGKALPSYIGANGYPHPLPVNLNFYGTGPGLGPYGFRDSSDPLQVSVTDPGAIHKRAETIALDFSHEFDRVTLLSTSAYTHSDVYYREDSDGTLLNVNAYADGARQNTLSQEIRLQGTADRLRWTAGLFAISINGTYFTYYAFPTFCDTQVTTFCSTSATGASTLDAVNGKGAATRTGYTLSTRSQAVFSQADYDLTDKLTVTLGGRLTEDSQYFDYNFQCIQDLPQGCTNIFGTPAGVTSLGPWNLSQKYKPWTGKLALSYKLDDDILFYTSASRGAKSSGYFSDLTGATQANNLGFHPEKLNDYEAGTKTSFFDKHLTANLGVFYYDYKDYQTFSFNGASTSILNRPAYARGGEFEMHADATHGVAVTFGTAYDSMFVKDISTPGGIQTQRPINAPLLQLNWGVTKVFSLPNGDKLTAGYDGRRTSERYFNIVNEETNHAPGFTLHDANLRLDRGNLWLNAWCTNFTNHVYSNVVFDDSFYGYYLSHIAEPRTFGLSFGYRIF